MPLLMHPSLNCVCVCTCVCRAILQHDPQTWDDNMIPADRCCTWLGWAGLGGTGCCAASLLSILEEASGLFLLPD